MLKETNQTKTSALIGLNNKDIVWVTSAKATYVLRVGATITVSK